MFSKCLFCPLLLDRKRKRRSKINHRPMNEAYASRTSHNEQNNEESNLEHYEAMPYESSKIIYE